MARLGQGPVIDIESVTRVDDMAALESALRDYLVFATERFRVLSGDVLDIDALATATLGNLSAYLPPQGRLFLARDAGGRLHGMVFLKRIRPDAGEIKRLYVAPSARGHGLAGRLMHRAMDEARDMDLSRILLDTARNMDAAIGFYRALGFRTIPPYPESENDPAMIPYLTHMEKHL